MKMKKVNNLDDYRFYPADKDKIGSPFCLNINTGLMYIRTQISHHKFILYEELEDLSFSYKNDIFVVFNALIYKIADSIPSVSEEEKNDIMGLIGALLVSRDLVDISMHSKNGYTEAIDKINEALAERILR